MTHHRIFLAPYVEGRAPADIQRYWRKVHASVFSATPGLLAYRQNRPVERYWDGLGHVCSELWWADRQAERDGFDSDYYATVVTEDEKRFTAHDRAWHARVLADDDSGDGDGGDAHYRVLGFGSDPSRLGGGVAERVAVVPLDRPTPNDGPPHVLSLWTDDRAEADAVAGALDGIAFVAEPSDAAATGTDILHTGDFRLSYANCDPAGIVYYATYYPVFERVHTEWSWNNGMPSDSLPPLWGVSVVSRASGCEYFHPALLHDVLRCEMRAGRVGSTSYTPTFDLVRVADDVLMARGWFTLVAVGADGRPAPLPASLRAVLTSPRT